LKCWSIENSPPLQYSNTPVLRIVRVTLLIFFISGMWVLWSGFPLYPPIYAKEDTIRHEVTGGIAWISDDYTYDNYVVNGVPSPASGNCDKKYLRGVISYSFLFAPVVEEHNTPISLRHFYTHPNTLTVNLSYQPEWETTESFSNPERNYRLSTAMDERSRSASLNIEYYIRRDTGLLFSLSSTKEEEQVRTSKIANPLHFRGTGENEEIRWYYGFGISQYPFDHLNIRLSYTAFEFEYIDSKKEWPEDSPLLFSDDFRDTNTTGKKIMVRGEYIVRKFLGIRGFYEFLDQKAHSKIWSLYYGNFPDLDTYYDDDISNHTVGLSLSLYLDEKTTIWTGGNYTVQELKQIYEKDQIIEYEGDIKVLEIGIVRHLNRHIGVQIEYEFAVRDQDVLIWHPESENDPRTTYETNTDLHTVYVGITGRF
jgi:hypothetical protein